MTSTNQPGEGGELRLERYLAGMGTLGASDLFLSADRPPAYRCDGAVRRGDRAAPSAEDMQRFVDRLLTPLARDRFRTSPDVDLALEVEALGRFRVNVFMHRGRLALVARRIPPGAVRFEGLGLPPAVRDLANARSGLILVVGPTGCGKSTTLAALIDHVNRTRPAHIVTIEDPIEFVHEEDRAVIHQRQVGVDTASFAIALRHVVRQNPDVVMIGEMRDRDSVETALRAALTGHLILSTLHTQDAVQSVDRMLAYFEAGARAQAQADLAHTLVGICSMRLVQKAEGQGRVAVVEVLRSTPTVRRLIADGELTELYDVIKRGGEVGMQTLNQALAARVTAGEITRETALLSAPNPEELKLNLEGMFTGIDSIDLRTEPREEEGDGWWR